jgi:hypothetical protein
MNTLTMAVMMLAAVAIGVEGRIADERILGSWIGKAHTGFVMKYRFTDREVVWNVDDEEFNKEFPGGIHAKYILEKGEKYLNIDMYDFNRDKLKNFTLRGILQFRDADHFRMTAPNEPTANRPHEFDENTVEFTRDQ